MTAPGSVLKSLLNDFKKERNVLDKTLVSLQELLFLNEQRQKNINIAIETIDEIKRIDKNL